MRWNGVEDVGSGRKEQREGKQTKFVEALLAFGLAFGRTQLRFLPAPQLPGSQLVTCAGVFRGQTCDKYLNALV